MAEGKREEEAEGLSCGRVFRSQSATDQTERNKPDHLYSSPGPLSSLRAAFKRTSARSHSQGDAGRARRRPEITILSVEPLPATAWFPGASGGFPVHATSSQSIWDGVIHTSGQPPPSYDQVIKEKTQEKVVTPTAPPRRSHTNTAATQTDCVEEHGRTPQQPGAAVVGKPRKPPRLCQPNSHPVKAAGPTVDTDNPTYPETAIIPNPTGPSQRPHPVPRPRSKPKQTDKVQTLVPLQDSGKNDSVTSVENDTLSSGKYLKELLEAFSSDPQLDLHQPEVLDDQQDQGKEDLTENMNSFHSDRNIRARIQAFEGQIDTDGAGAPFPRPRNIYSKSPVGVQKPAIAPRSSLSSTPAEEEAAAPPGNFYEETSLPPPLAPKPQPPRKPSFSCKEESKPQPPIKTALLPSRPPLVRSKTVGSQDDEVAGPLKGPPLPLKPSKNPLNLNNHNSTALLLNASQTLATAENEYVDAPISHVPIKPARGGGLSTLASSTQSMKRPTVIRVPSRGSRSQDEDFPPPLPIQKAVGGPTPPLKLTNKEFFSSSADPCLPPQPSRSKVPPPRPPPAKTAPDRPPPPRRNSVQLPVLQQGARPRSSLQPLNKQSCKKQKKGPILPPRPNPGHRLYNTYTLEIPHGIAEFDYNGIRTGELSFQKNEVLVLLNQIDSSMFECQVGDAKGTVQKSHIKIITPLSNHYNNANNPVPVQERSSNQAFRSSVENGTFEVQALFDFTPVGPGELGLRAGDVVTNVEQLDSEWYLGSCRGITGFFPINYVRPLNQSSAPAPAPAASPAPAYERKVQPAHDTLRGPRCVARFDFEGEQSDELSFSEGDVIQLCEYVGEEWARGEFRGREGIFPLNFVEVLEDLPPPAEQNHAKIPLPGMAASFNTPAALTPAQVESHGVEWVEALYDFTAEAEDELPFVQGDMILVTKHLDMEWCSGRLNGREGIFPAAFVRTFSGGFP
ncbi:SH3 domain-containing protein 19 [Pygocentrus nattereri]|uniref:SH3 domain-containing protein n=1 Tax=Pygocentrus nattereri TaxID=42514 RepID=A0A3B4E6U7_PYGNA|nr:SH3 domain-containing protein 19 [Pygocentrus nattereri]